MPRRRVIAVGDIILAISSLWPIESIRLEETYLDFLSDGEPEITIEARYEGLPEIELRDEDRVFDSEMVWSLYQIDGQHVFVLQVPGPPPVPYRIARFETNFRQGLVYSQAPESWLSPDGLLANPLEYPLSEVLMICLLAQGRGVMVHACGIDDGGQGYLFAGNSTHGKSTMARLWQDGATILNDDRIILRQREGRFWMYGTPWHGDYMGVSSRGVPLAKVFFLHHDTSNNTHRQGGIAAASKLLARCFPPLWDETGMGFTLDFLALLVEAVPCYDLGFVPDRQVIDVVRCVK